MRRLAIFWLACAAIGFVAAICAACMLSFAVDGAASWRADRPASEPPKHGAPTPGAKTAGGPPPLAASALGGAAGS